MDGWDDIEESDNDGNGNDKEFAPATLNRVGLESYLEILQIRGQ